MKSAENPGTGDNESPDGKVNLALAWNGRKELGNSQRHFNNREAEYRTLASIWLLPGFAGMGFIVKETPQLPLPGAAHSTGQTGRHRREAEVPSQGQVAPS